MSDFIDNARNQARVMHGFQSLDRFERCDDGQPLPSYALGRQYGTAVAADARSGRASPYLVTVAALGVMQMRDEAMLHGFCTALQQGLERAGATQ